MRTQLLSVMFLVLFAVACGSINRVIPTLTGSVKNRMERKAIEDAANSVRGVKRVINDITIKS